MGASSVDLDRWIEKVKRCEYLAEDELKALCEYVSGGSGGSQRGGSLLAHVFVFVARE
jgi:hypothetical protein